MGLILAIIEVGPPDEESHFDVISITFLESALTSPRRIKGAKFFPFRKRPLGNGGRKVDSHRRVFAGLANKRQFPHRTPF
jgi:hypothetical protein